MLHVISARCVARDLHTNAPGPTECTCRRQFVAQWGDCEHLELSLHYLYYHYDCQYYPPSTPLHHTPKRRRWSQPLHHHHDKSAIILIRRAVLRHRQRVPRQHLTLFHSLGRRHDNHHSSHSSPPIMAAPAGRWEATRHPGRPIMVSRLIQLKSF